MQPQEQANAHNRAHPQRLVGEQLLAQTSSGLSPNRDKTLPPNRPSCKADFGRYAGWKVLPLL